MRNDIVVGMSWSHSLDFIDVCAASMSVTRVVVMLMASVTTFDLLFEIVSLG